VWNTGQKRGHSRDIAVVFAGLIRTAKHNFVERLPIAPGEFLAQSSERQRR
jgi:hypothetical protein